MSALTIEQRYACYKEAQYTLRYMRPTAYSICVALRNIVIHRFNIRGVSVHNILDHFPELCAYRPPGTDMHDYWWPPNNLGTRLQVLNRIREELKVKMR